MTGFIETFSFSYNKRKITELFKDLETTVGISKIQNYIPIYNMFFSLNITKITITILILIRNITSIDN